MGPPPDRPVVTGLVGVYDATGTLWGELSYWIGARLGRAHCALCDITHGLVTERSDWRVARDGLPVPFEAFHLDDQPREVATGAAGRAPVVLARTSHGIHLVLTPDDLRMCHGSPARLVEALDRAVASAGLSWPPVS
jgi:hypothetical protein